MYVRVLEKRPVCLVLCVSLLATTVAIYSFLVETFVKEVSFCFSSLLFYTLAGFLLYKTLHVVHLLAISIKSFSETLFDSNIKKLYRMLYKNLENNLGWSLGQ